MDISTYTAMGRPQAAQEQKSSMERQKEHAPVRSPEELEVIRNLSKIEVINERKRYLADQCREHPLEPVRRLGWEIEIEALSFKEEKLLKRNAKLWKALGRNELTQDAILTAPLSISRPPQQVTGYHVPVITQLLTQNQLREIEKKLEDLYDRKDRIFFAIQQSETCIAHPDQRQELDEIIALEATLTAHAGDLRMKDIDIDAIHAVHDQMHPIKSIENKAMQEIRSVRAGQQPDRETETARTRLDSFDMINEEENRQSELNDLSARGDSSQMRAYNEIQDVRESQEHNRAIDEDIDWEHESMDR